MIWPWERKIVCVRCGIVRRSGDWERLVEGEECSHVFFSTRDHVGIRIVRGRV